jgi:DNA polymerase
MAKPTYLSIDLETRSAVDLKKTGVYPYAAHPTTDVWCAAYARGDGPVDLWFAGEPLPGDLADALRDPSVYLRAWNANFERILMRDVLAVRHRWPLVPLKRFVCSAVLGRAAGLPGNLEGAAIALGLAEQKDMAGHRLMMQMSRPREVLADGTPLWVEDEDKAKLLRLGQYCRQDVQVEREVFLRLPPAMDARERKLYLADQRINDRGVLLDLARVRAAQEIADRERARLNREMRRVTRSAVAGATKLTDLTRFVKADSPGVEVPSLDKETLELLLARAPLGEASRRALEIRQEAGKSSVSKLDAMLLAAGSDGRVRGLLQFYGAGTGRWAGRLVQPQNFPRGAVKMTPEILSAIDTGRPELVEPFGQPMEVVSSALRAMLVSAPGKQFFSADYAQIEARVVAWLAGQEDLVRMFRNGEPVYEDMASRISEVRIEEVTPEQRQVGKMAVLACGFGMGAKTFARQAGVDIETATRAVQAYRDRNSRIRALWWSTQDTALEVVTKGLRGPLPVPGTRGRICFGLHGNWLKMTLPSHRSLWYYDPQVVMRPVPWDDDPRPAVQVMSVNSVTRKWEPASMYGGLWVENATQAVARDIMADAIVRLEEDCRFPVILTVHDEILAESREPESALPDFVALLSDTPEWASGCPIKAEGWNGTHYRK